MDYLEWKIELQPLKPWNEIVVAGLAELGFESFVDQENGVDAYIQAELVDFEKIENYLTELNLVNELTMNVSHKLLPHENWNATWEADFEPVFVDDYGTILAPFHDRSLARGMIIDIQPQMSFGTGHHQTTYLMCKSLFELEIIPQKVLDVGAGTGILAILSEKLGARHCVAVDIEEWSAANCLENANRNGCQHIVSLHGDIDVVKEGDFGMILANINRNVLTRHLPNYFGLMQKGGILFLSGFFETDCDDLITIASENGFAFLNKKTKENWACLQFKK